MNKAIGSILFLTTCLTGPYALAQGTLQFSNLEQRSSDAVAIAGDAWASQPFGTGHLGVYRYWILNSVQVSFSDPAGNPAGLSLSIDEGTRDGTPGQELGTLSGPVPTSAGVYTFSTPGIKLADGIAYWLVLRGVSPGTDGSYFWNVSSTTTADTSTDWYARGTFGGSYLFSADGDTWTAAGTTPLQFGIYATVVPEPPSAALLGLGAAVIGIFLIAQCRRSRVLSVGRRSL